MVSTPWYPGMRPGEQPLEFVERDGDAIVRTRPGQPTAKSSRTACDTAAVELT